MSKKKKSRKGGGQNNINGYNGFERHGVDRSFVELNYDDSSSNTNNNRNTHNSNNSNNNKSNNNNTPTLDYSNTNAFGNGGGNNDRSTPTGHGLDRYQTFAKRNSRQNAGPKQDNLYHQHNPNSQHYQQRGQKYVQHGQHGQQANMPDLDQKVLNVLYHQPLLPGYSDLNKFKIPIKRDGDEVGETDGKEKVVEGGSDSHVRKKAKVEQNVNDKNEVNTILEQVGLRDDYSDEGSGEDNDGDEEYDYDNDNNQSDDEDEDEDEYYDNTKSHTSGPLDKETGQRPAFPIPKLSDLLRRKQSMSANNEEKVNNNDSSNSNQANNANKTKDKQDGMEISYEVLEYLARVKHEASQRPSFVAIPRAKSTTETCNAYAGKGVDKTLEQVLNVAAASNAFAAQNGGRTLKAYEQVSAREPGFETAANATVNKENIQQIESKNEDLTENIKVDQSKDTEMSLVKDSEVSQSKSSKATSNNKPKIDTFATKFQHLFITETITLNRNWYNSFLNSFRLTKQKLDVAVRLKQNKTNLHNNYSNPNLHNTPNPPAISQISQVSHPNIQKPLKFSECKKYLAPTSTTLPTPLLLASLDTKTVYDLLAHVDRCLQSQRSVSTPFAKWVYALLARCPEVLEANKVVILREIAKKCVRMKKRGEREREKRELEKQEEKDIEGTDGKEKENNQEDGMSVEMKMFVESTVAIVAGFFGQTDLVEFTN